MPAEIISLDRFHPSRAIARCSEVIRAGGIVAYPTDTFYGLGADPRNRSAVERLFRIKGRKGDQPILLLLSDEGVLAEWAAVIPPIAERLCRRYWPGRLTLVFPAREEVLPQLTAGTGTIGLRLPDDDLLRRLLRDAGTALTGTSANRTGGPNPTSARDVEASLGGQIDLIVDGGALTSTQPSTVVDVSRVPARIIRQGAAAVTEADLLP
ncbi:MAG: L-threonylcarbamoyladenylate synthase [Nitrospiraceae bacterium]|nr:L-threonylcarbamoyladenylate synthase [Nitrospiraceae bacterium]